MNKVFTYSAAVVFAATGAYAFTTWRYLSSVDIRKIFIANTISESFRRSRSVRSIVNPRGNIAWEDSRSTTVKVPAGITVEVLLARFVKGFFGGYVFAPEAAIFKTFLRADHVDFSSLKEQEVPARIWSASEISNTELPPLYSIFFGAFQVIDCEIDTALKASNLSNTQSYIDFAWGSDERQFDGVHRFSILRDREKCEAEDEDVVEIRYECTALNPTVDKPLKPEVFIMFHLRYAMVLFREGVSRVLKR